MPTYEYEEEHFRRRRDDHSPEYYSGGGPQPRRSSASPGRAVPPLASNDDEVDGMRLEAPPDAARPRSVPPGTSLVVRRPRSRSRSRAPSSTPSSSSSLSPDGQRGGSLTRRNRSPSPVTRARNVVDSNFSNSTAGIGASLLGAVVGGLVAREASDAANRHRHKERGYETRDNESESRTRIVSTILGAVAGGLGANALTNRIEDSRERDRARQQAWERRHGREEDLPHYDTGRPADLDHRSGRRLPPPSEQDDDYDFVYHDQRYDDRRPSRPRSDDSYRYP